jgi:hypothetical protein
MADLPLAILTVSGAFAPLVARRLLMHVKRWLVGAIRAPGKRTVTAVLRVMGTSGAAHCQNSQRGRTRAPWSSLDASRRLRGLLLDAFAPAAPVVRGLDETMARRRGERIAAQGISRDPVRSSQAHVVNARGLRWVGLTGLARIPWVDRVWALPVLTVCAPSERYDQGHGRHPQSWLERARQLVRLVRRGVPTTALVVVGDPPYAALAWRDAVRQSRRCEHARAPGGRARCASPTVDAQAKRAAASAGDAPADARAPRRGPDNPLAAGQHGAVVWPARTSCPQHRRHRRLVSLGVAAGAEAVGPPRRSGAPVCTPSVAVDAAGARPGAAPHLVRPTLAERDDL